MQVYECACVINNAFDLGAYVNVHADSVLSGDGGFFWIRIECVGASARCIYKNHIAVVARHHGVVEHVPLYATVHSRCQRVAATNQAIRVLAARKHVARTRDWRPLFIKSVGKVCHR